MFRSALDALAVLGEFKKRGVSLHMIDLGGDTTGNGVSRLVAPAFPDGLSVGREVNYTRRRCV
jgi:hypothetical protein